MNPLSIHHRLDTLLDAANHHRIDSSEKNCVRLVSNCTNRCTRRSGDLKSKDHMHHHSLEDLFHRHWGYHPYGILWWVSPVNLLRCNRLQQAPMCCTRLSPNNLDKWDLSLPFNRVVQHYDSLTVLSVPLLQNNTGATDVSRMATICAHRVLTIKIWNTWYPRHGSTILRTYINTYCNNNDLRDIE